DFHYIAAPRPELFDLRKDPGERSNLVAEHPQVVRRLHRQLRELDRSLSPPGQDDAEALARLAALGYLSGGAGAAEGPLPDPKDRVEVIGQLGRAASFGQEGKWREAADIYRDIVEREPRMALVWQQLGGALVRLDQRREAIEAYEKALELSRGAPHLATTLAELHFEAGDLDRARRHAELAGDREPMAHDVLAKVALSEGDLEAAERHSARAIAGRGRRIAPLITQAAVLNRQGRYDQALAVSAAAEAAFGAREDEAVLMNLFFHRGTSLGHLGRFDEAKSAYRRAIELGPDHLPAYSAFAFLLALEGDAAEAGRVLRQMVTENVTPRAYAEAVRTLRAMDDEASAAAVLAQALKRWPGSEELGGF
ncbi:MAG TPA: tetratricopeptide repeat protein, partial [Planctomycetota bacterium]|nr:tetratricopeptide repeat protein [Planctomycetota bacterium]